MLLAVTSVEDHSFDLLLFSQPKNICVATRVFVLRLMNVSVSYKLRFELFVPTKHDQVD